jgi:hypothetical protein
MSLKQIDFSNGIRSEDIQYNFNQVSDEIARERLAISGHGISSGLNFVIDGFKLKVTSGSLIDLNGEEVFINETILDIPLPRLIIVNEPPKTIGGDGQIVLSNVPYSVTRQCASQYDIPNNYGITITDYSNTSKTLPIISINGNTILTDARWAGQLAKVVYNYSNKRYDTIYIGTDNQIKVIEGITSNSPSVSMPNMSDYKYILGIVEVQPYSVQSNGSIIAKLSVEKDMKSLRNIYTDSNNNLYLCGVSFDDLQIIHMVEPVTPYENQLWYDAVSNKLRVWKTVDGIAQWNNVNDTSIIPVKEYKIWTPENNPVGGQLFIFHMTDDMNMRFVPARNELEVIIDNGPLHSDQFEEITLDEVKNDAALKQLLITSYGYTDTWITETDSQFENIGVGFKLAQPLDKNCYVEVRATHRVNDNPLRNRFQRSATFSSTDSFTYDSANGKVVTTKAPYRVGECQLEVFVDGKRAENIRDYTEGIDLATEARIKGASSSQFIIVADIPDGARVTYKITTNIYSYDHVEMIVGDLADRVNAAEQTITTQAQNISDFVSSTNTNLTTMDTRLKNIETNELQHANFVTKTDVLTTDNMPASINTWIPKDIINTSIVKNGSLVQVTGISPEDFIVMFDIQSTGGNSILRRGISYEITKDQTSGLVYINFIDPNAVPNGDTLYIIGIKFKV